ncbi:hypothetical protein [uncultured Sphingomonas sp.]|uniref:hypothetical protein n=1 Tax=uncultured Sphingomonas sp. TaxID=158754 RepID=UPI0035C9F1BC
MLVAVGALPRLDYARCVGHLAAMRHDHVSLDGDVLVQMLAMDDPRAEALFDAAIHYIGGPKAEIASHAAATAGFMTRIWGTELPSWRMGRGCGKLIEKLLRLRGEHWRQVLGLLDRLLAAERVTATARGDLARAYLRDWVRGHFLDRAPATARRHARRKARRGVR